MVIPFKLMTVVQIPASTMGLSPIYDAAFVHVLPPCQQAVLTGNRHKKGNDTYCSGCRYTLPGRRSNAEILVLKEQCLPFKRWRMGYKRGIQAIVLYHRRGEKYERGFDIQTIVRT